MVPGYSGDAAGMEASPHSLPQREKVLVRLGSQQKFLGLGLQCFGATVLLRFGCWLPLPMKMDYPEWESSNNQRKTLPMRVA